MTAAQFKETEKAIKRASAVFKKDKKKAREFLFTIGLINKKGQSKTLVRKTA